MAMFLTKRGEFGSILYKCYKSAFTGAISVITKQNHHTLHLSKGRPIFIKEQKTTMPLGRVFVELGMIDNREYDESLMEMAKTGERQGEILLRKGIITLEQMRLAISVQFYRKALKFFEISEGELKIEENAELPHKGSENVSNISTLKIIYNGIKSLNKEHILKLAPITPNTVITRKEELDITLFSLPINAEETTLIENIKIKTPISHLIQLKISSDTEAIQLVYFLFLTELIELSTLDISETDKSDDGYIKLSGIYKPDEVKREERAEEIKDTDEKTTIAPISAIQDIEWINQLYEKYQTMDYYEFFNISRTASTDELNAAYQKFLKRLNTVKNDANIDEELSVRIDQLTYFAEEAYNTLISEKSRREYNSVISAYYSKSVRDEGKAEIEFTKGEVLLGKRDFENAFESFKKAIEFGGQRPEYVAAYGISLYLNPNEAQRSRETLGKLYIKRALSQMPKYIEGHLYYLLISYIEKNYKDIENEITFLKNTYPNNEKVQSVISLVEKCISQKQKSGEIRLALREENKDNRVDQLLDILFKA